MINVLVGKGVDHTPPDYSFEGARGTERASASVEVRGLGKSFKGRRVLDSISFEIYPGESVALLGPNGAGKTTTLLTILGVITPDQGEVWLRGYSMPRGRRRALEKTGFAAGYLSLPDLMRVKEALLVFADFYAVPSPRRRVEEVIDLFGIRHLERSLNGTLSAGQRTLVSLAKAVLCGPEVLILDEPTASLDPDVARRTRRLLEDLHEELGCTMLVTSHNMREVEELAQRVIFLHQGRIVADGSPHHVAETLGAEDLEDAFIELAEVGRNQRPTV
ncbi:MAG: hypothetical protein C4317_06320 [Acidimicrobiia bacterium]